MRVVFFGTPEFALPSLKALVAAGLQDKLEVVAVVAPPDRPRGRGLDRIEPPRIAKEARAINLTLLQPERPSEAGFVERLTALRPDTGALVAYGHLIPDPVLALFPEGIWNVHPSLLPRWRGPAPIHRAIWAGDAETGVSIIRLVAKLDAGPVAAQERTPIGPGETRRSLERRLAEMGAALLVRVLERVRNGSVTLEEQEEGRATYAATFKPEDGRVDFSRPAAELDRLVRTLSPSPTAWFTLGAERVKVLEAASGPPVPGAAAGTLVEQDRAGRWRVACGEGALWLARVQPEGKGTMRAADFLNGRRLGAGASLVT